MRNTLIGGVAALLLSTGAAQAGCDFFEHNDHQGAKLALQAGECAVFSGNSDAACQGAKAKFVDGWDNMISSVVLNHNSVAILEDYANGGHASITVEGNRGTNSLGDFNDKASLVICK